MIKERGCQIQVELFSRYYKSFKEDIATPIGSKYKGDTENFEPKYQEDLCCQIGIAPAEVERFSSFVATEDRDLWKSALEMFSSIKPASAFLTKQLMTINDYTPYLYPSFVENQGCWLCIRLSLDVPFLKSLNVHLVEHLALGEKVHFAFMARLQPVNSLVESELFQSMFNFNMKKFGEPIKADVHRTESYDLKLSNFVQWNNRAQSSEYQFNQMPKNGSVNSANKVHSLVLWPLYPAAFTLLTEKLGRNCEPDAVDLDVDFTELLEQKFHFPNASAPITALLYLSLSKHLLAPGSSASIIELKHWFIRAVPELTASIVVEVFSIVRLLGYPPHTLVNKSLDSLVHPSDSQALNRWLLGTENEDTDANEIVCRWRCANSSYTWLSITRLRDSTASTQNADASEQRYQPSTLSNASSYRLTWLAGPQTLKGFYDPFSVTHTTSGLPTETLAGTCQNEENSGNNTHQKENAMDVDQQSNFNSNRCFPPTSVHPEIPMMNSQTHLRTSRATTQQANEECMSLQFCFKDYPKLMPNNTKRNKPLDIRYDTEEAPWAKRRKYSSPRLQTSTTSALRNEGEDTRKERHVAETENAETGKTVQVLSLRQRRGMKSPLTLDLKQICTWRYSKDTQEQSTEQNCTPSTMDNASSDIQACSIVGVLHSFSPFTCAAEQPRDLTILPLTKSNLIRHTRMQKWVHHYQILQQQLNDSRSEDQSDPCHLTEGTHQRSESRPEVFFHIENSQHRLEHPEIVLTSEESGWVDLFKPGVCDMGQKKRENNVNFSYAYAQNYGQRTNANSVEKLGSEAMKIPAEYTLTNHPHLSTCGFTLNHPPSPNLYSKRTHRQAFGSYNSVGAVCVADKAVNTGPQLWPIGWVENPKIAAGCTGGQHRCNNLAPPCPCRRRCCSSGASYAHTSANELNISSCYNCQHGNCAVRMSHPCPTYGSSMNYHPQCHPLSNEMLLLPVGDVHAYNSGSNATGTYHSTLLQSGVNGSMGLAYVPENRGPHTWRGSVCTRCRDVQEIPLCCHMNEHNTIQGIIPAQPTHGPPMNSFSYAMSNWCNSQKQPTLYALDPTQPQPNRQAQCTAPNMKIIPRETMEGGVCSKHIQPPAFSSMTKSIVFSAASAMAMCGLETNTRQPLSMGIQQTVANEPTEQLIAPNSMQAQIQQGAVVPELPFRLHMVANGKSTTVQPISVAAATNISARALVGLNSLATLTQHQAVEIKGSNNSRESCQAVGQNYYNLILRCKNDQKTCSSSVAATTSSAIRCRPMNSIGPGSTWFGMAERSAIELSATG